MTRPIKYRAWDITGKKMLDVLQLDPGSKARVRTEEGFLCDGEFDLMQFTGLLDRHGKEIWEDDVIKCFDTEGGEVYNHRVEIPHFFRECWSQNEYQLPAGAGQRCVFVEVIGNVMENPELLKS